MSIVNNPRWTHRKIFYLHIPPAVENGGGKQVQNLSFVWKPMSFFVKSFNLSTQEMRIITNRKSHICEFHKAVESCWILHPLKIRWKTRWKPGKTLQFPLDFEVKMIIQIVIPHFSTLLTDFSTVCRWKTDFRPPGKKYYSPYIVSCEQQFNAYFSQFPQIIAYRWLC